MKKYRGLPTNEWPPGEWAALASRISSRSRRDPNYHSGTQSAKQLARLTSGYGCCLAWLRDQGRIDVTLSAVQRWPAPVVERLVDDMKVRKYRPGSIRVRLETLKGVLSRLVHGADLRHITNEIDLLPNTTPALPAVLLRVSTADLVRLGVDMMEEAYCATDVESAVHFRTGLQIAQLALRPWRAGSFSNIQIGEHLKKTTTGWRLVAPKEQGRIKRDASCDYPQRLLKYLVRYLGHHRETLCKGGNGGSALWVISTGKPFSKGLLHYYLTKATRQRFGDAIYPHAFRKCLTTTIAIDNPAAIGIVPTALGHSQKVNEEWYAMASAFSAFKQLDDAIEGELRDGHCRSRWRRRLR